LLKLRFRLAARAIVVKESWMDKSESAPNTEEQAEPPPFTSSHTSNFPELLRQMGISLLVSTYQAGKLIVVRHAQGDVLNTHFRNFNSPMGVAYHRSNGKLAIGAKHEVWTLHNQPDVAAKLDPPGSHDAAFLPRTRHQSGDIRIHEIGWVGNELWAVNTRFSCLCTFDDEHSFVPRWRPPFVKSLMPGDNCHLNGMCIVDGRVKYVTCLGETDTPGGWRRNKRDGGLLLDVDSGEVLLYGLSMPHSPRFYGGHPWVLESGHGTLSLADLNTGKTEVVAKLPGFTRGIDFHGNLAFIGLSQVRESAVFSGIPLVEDLEERTCGVWVLDLRTGKTIAFLRFEGTVQEIFAVQVMPGILHPDIINEPGEMLDSSFVLPDEALREVPEELRAPASAVKQEA
jgi:uncharacterized protein (TIGR03032 family)